MVKKSTKNFVVIYGGNDWNVEVPISYELTRKAFEKWQVMAIKRGIEMFRASIRWYDVEKNVFLKSWAFREGKWNKVETPITPDFVYDKTPGGKEHVYYDIKIAISKNAKMFNNPLFRTMVDSKLSQYILFSEFMPTSLVAINENELKELINKIRTSLVVVKPIQGSGGYGIIIDEKEKILEKKIVYPVIVQEFIENCNGIPGFSQKGELADLRIVFMNHKPTYALSRIAKKGSYFTNLHQGAQSVRVPLEKIPESVWNVTEKIIKKLSIFTNAQYSLDFFFSKEEKPYFIEMNTVPGLCLIEAMGDVKLQEEDFLAIISLI